MTPAMQQAIAASGLPVWERGSESESESAATAVHSGSLVICVPPSLTARPGSTVLVPQAVLGDVCEWNLPVQTVGVDHPRTECLSVENPGGREIPPPLNLTFSCSPVLHFAV